MAEENQSRGLLGKMEPKQKIMIAVFIVIVLIIIWQVMGLFGGETAPVPPTPTTAATTPGAPSPTPAPGKPPVLAAPAPGAVTPEIIKPKNTVLIQMQQDNQEKYLAAVNQLQVLRIQREIAEQNQAIAAANLATRTAEKGVTELLTKPAIAPVPASAYAPGLVSPARQGELVTTPAGPATTTQTEVVTTTVTEPSIPDAPYVVISVSMNLKRWNAVLGFQGKLYSVGIGDLLPIDGSKVSAISSSGVTLLKDGKKRKISIVSSI